MKEQYLVCVQHRYHEKDGTYYNLRKLLYGLNNGLYYTTLEQAERELNEYIKRHRCGARTETNAINGIGIDFIIDNDTAYQHEVTRYYIKKRLVTPFEVVTEV